MVVICNSCKTHCISWAMNKQSCKCGKIKGFIVENENIIINADENSNISVWMPNLQSYKKYENGDKYEYNFWSGFQGEKFAI